MRKILAVNINTSDIEKVKSYIFNELKNEVVGADAKDCDEKDEYQIRLSFDVMSELDEIIPYVTEKGFLSVFMAMKEKGLISHFNVVGSFDKE